MDQLGQTNSDGSAHSYRYQDVQKLLAAGINVIAAIHIGDIEGTACPGSAAHQQIPRSIILEADELEFVTAGMETFQASASSGATKTPTDTAAQVGTERLLRLREEGLELLVEHTEMKLSRLAIKRHKQDIRHLASACSRIALTLRTNWLRSQS